MEKSMVNQPFQQIFMEKIMVPNSPRPQNGCSSPSPPARRERAAWIPRRPPRRSTEAIHSERRSRPRPEQFPGAKDGGVSTCRQWLGIPQLLWLVENVVNSMVNHRGTISAIL